MRVRFDGIEEIIRRFQQIQERVEHPEGFLRDVRQEMSQSTDRTFNAQGLPTRWRSRKSMKESHPILDKTGHLRDASASTSPGNGSISRILIDAQESSLEFGTDVSYGKYHQQPKELDHLKTGKMPMRRFLLLFIEDVNAWITRGRRFFWSGKR